MGREPSNSGLDLRSGDKVVLARCTVYPSLHSGHKARVIGEPYTSDGITKVPITFFCSAGRTYANCDTRNLMKIGSYMKISKPAITTGVALLAMFMLVGLFIGNYNSLVVARSTVDNSWAKVETQYQRRLDLVDNIVQSVKGSQGQEQKVFGQIADARKQYSNASTTDEKAAAASKVETTIAMLPRLQEQYPELKSNEQVSKLITELQGTENTIAAKRDAYNDTVTAYNNKIGVLPGAAFANLFNFHKASQFKADAAAATAPKVDFK